MLCLARFDFVIKLEQHVAACSVKHRRAKAMDDRRQPPADHAQAERHGKAQMSGIAFMD